MSKAAFAVIIAASFGMGVAIAADGAAGSSLEARLERIEQAIARVEQRLSAGAGGGMMEGCRDMMRGGMMGGREGRRGGSPNDQWQQPQ